MVNINVRVDSSHNGGGASGDCENFAQMPLNRKPLEENQTTVVASLPEPGSEMSNLQRIAVCRLANAHNGRPAGLEQEKRVRREIANSNERRRMQSINAGFQSLRALLPRKDGEKMSKASILQQTADLLKNLQTEKAVLSQQNIAYRKKLEMIGETPVTGQHPSVNAECANQKRVARNTGHPIPPPKKRKFEFVNDTPEEVLGGLSDFDTGKSSPQVQLAFCVVGNSGKASWETEMLQNELTKLRLALEQERRMRLLLEDQLRAVELSRIQTMGLGRLPGGPPLINYNGLSGTSTVLTTSVSVTLTPKASNTLYSNSPTTVLIPKADHHPQLQQAATNVVGGIHASFAPGGVGVGTLIPATPISLSTPATPNQKLPSLDCGRIVTNPVAESFRNLPPQPAPTDSGSSKQSLHAIVEAIRHLEGDQLFVEVDSATGTTPKGSSTNYLTPVVKSKVSNLSID